MPIDEISKKYRSLDDWFSTPQGHRVAKAFAAELFKAKNQIYGKTLLQLGICGQNVWLESLHFYRKWLITPFLDIRNSSLISSMSSLPFDRNSLDCIIAPFTQEIIHADHSLYVEIDRILKPMGHVVFFGINPWSVWGGFVKFGNIPYLNHAIEGLTSSFRVKHTMLNIGYKQYAHASFYYIPPVTKESTIHKLEFLNQIGKMLWPFPAGFYCLILQKNQYCPTGLSFADEAELIVGEKSSMTVSGNMIHDKLHT